jgi:hypothetical protein
METDAVQDPQTWGKRSNPHTSAKDQANLSPSPRRMTKRLERRPLTTAPEPPLQETLKQANPRRCRHRGVEARRLTSTAIHRPTAEEPGSPPHSAAPRANGGEGADGSTGGRRNRPRVACGYCRGGKESNLTAASYARLDP